MTMTQCSQTHRRPRKPEVEILPEAAFPHLSGNIMEACRDQCEAHLDWPGRANGREFAVRQNLQQPCL